MPDAVDRDRPGEIVDREQHAIVADPEAVAIDAGHLFNVHPPRLVSQVGEPFQDDSALGDWNRPKIFVDTGIVDEAVHELRAAVSASGA